MLSDFFTALDWIGLVAFAVTGGLVAARKEMDIFGFIALATATGIGGGTIRDVILDISPVFWVGRPEYLLVCVAVGVVAYFTAHIPQSRYRLVMWFDAVGLSFFCVVGAQRAFELGTSPAVAVMMGIATATFGGIVRNVLGGEQPVLPQREFYPAAAFAGSSLFIAGLKIGMGVEIAALIGFAVCFLIRGLTLHFGWRLPAYRSRS